MLYETTPANQNVSLSELTRNPQRELADHVLAVTLQELEAEGVHPQILSEVLFDLTFISMQPGDPVITETAITWFSQLHRFRDRLQSKIEEIERIYEDNSN